MIGIVKAEGYDQKTYLHNQNMAWFYYAANGNAYHNASGSSFGTALGVGDYLEFLLDTVGGTLKVKRNGTLIGTNMFSSLDDTDYLVAFDGDSTSGMGGEFDFGQSGYEPSDSNYTTICTNNLLEPSITLPGEHFNTVLYTGNGVGSRAITGVGFQPDYVWLKQTNNPTAYGHQNFDVIRGATNYLVPNTTAQENDGTPSYGDQTLLSFDSDGFSIGTSDTINESGYQVASWNWKASGSTTSNTEGTITSTVSANTTAGFSICKYTGNGTGNATFGHGLSTSPDLVVIKSITTVHGWMVWSPTFGSSGGDCTYLMSWDGTGGLGNWCEDTIRLNGTTKVQIGSSSGGTTYSWVNKTGTDYIAYCWNNIEGYSKRGIYYGNGISDGPFIYTGFRPAYLWVKGQAGSQHWHVFDTKRYPYNQTTNTTTTGTVIDEAANAGGGGGEGMGPIDILSNGFKLRANNGNGNDTSTTFTYLAFAESPFKYARAR